MFIAVFPLKKKKNKQKFLATKLSGTVPLLFFFSSGCHTNPMIICTCFHPKPGHHEEPPAYLLPQQNTSKSSLDTAHKRETSHGQLGNTKQWNPGSRTTKNQKQQLNAKAATRPSSADSATHTPIPDGKQQATSDCRTIIKQTSRTFISP